MRRHVGHVCDADVYRWLPIEERAELRVTIGHVQQRDLSLGLEAQELIHAELAGGERALATAVNPGQGQGCGGDADELAAREHAEVAFALVGELRGRPGTLLRSRCLASVRRSGVLCEPALSIDGALRVHEERHEVLDLLDRQQIIGAKSGHL